MSTHYDKIKKIQKKKKKSLEYDFYYNPLTHVNSHFMKIYAT
jgi:hypothetical protein